MTCFDIAYICIKIENVYSDCHFVCHSVSYYVFYSTLFSILFAVLFTNAIQVLFPNIGQVIGQETHTGLMMSSFFRYLDLSEQPRIITGPLEELSTVPLALSTCCRHHWRHHSSFPQKISPHPFLNNVPNMYILDLKSRGHYKFICTSVSCW